MRALLTAALILCAGPALALSCLRPDVATSYARAAEAEETYIVVHGRLVFDQSRIPDRDLGRHDPEDTLVPARLTGQALSRTGFDRPFDRDVTLRLQCAGPWCASAVSGVEYLIFLQKTDTGYVVPADPCSSMVFAEPTGAQLDQAAACMAGKGCAPRQ